MEGLPFADQEVLAQVKRICAHKRLFSKTANLQEYLHFLVSRRLSGDDDLDHYTGKRLAWDFFKKDTSIGKVEGNKLRKRLRVYYQTDGTLDPIVIQIPPGPYRPELVANPHLLPPLSGQALELVWSANTLSGSLDTAYRANELLGQALKIHPQHPRLLGLRAKYFVELTLFEGMSDCTTLWKAAEQVVHEAKAGGLIPWEISYAEGATEASLHRNWTAADQAFRRAVAISPDQAGKMGMYIDFLTSQQRFDEALDPIFYEYRSATEGLQSLVPRHFELLALLQSVAGRVTLAWEEMRRFQRVFPTVTPSIVFSIVAEAAGHYRAALDFMERKEFVLGRDTRLQFALTSLCAGRLGRTDQAREAYNRIISADAAVGIVEEKPVTSSYYLGIAAIGLGEPDTAVEWLTRSVLEDHHPMNLLINNFPAFRHISDHPGFRSLVIDRMTLELGPALTHPAGSS